MQADLQQFHGEVQNWLQEIGGWCSIHYFEQAYRPRLVRLNEGKKMTWLRSCTNIRFFQMNGHDAIQLKNADVTEHDHQLEVGLCRFLEQRECHKAVDKEHDYISLVEIYQHVVGCENMNYEDMVVWLDDLNYVEMQSLVKGVDYLDSFTIDPIKFRDRCRVLLWRSSKRKAERSDVGRSASRSGLWRRFHW